MGWLHVIFLSMLLKSLESSYGRSWSCKCYFQHGHCACSEPPDSYGVVFFFSVKRRFLAAGEHVNCNFPYISYGKREEGVATAQPCIFLSVGHRFCNSPSLKKIFSENHSSVNHQVDWSLSISYMLSASAFLILFFLYSFYVSCQCLPVVLDWDWRLL